MEKTKTIQYYPSTTSLGSQRTEDTDVPINWAIAQLQALKSSAGSEQEQDAMRVTWPVKVYGTHDLTADELKDARIDLLTTTMKNWLDRDEAPEKSEIEQVLGSIE